MPVLSRAPLAAAPTATPVLPQTRIQRAGDDPPPPLPTAPPPVIGGHLAPPRTMTEPPVFNSHFDHAPPRPSPPPVIGGQPAPPRPELPLVKTPPTQPEAQPRSQSVNYTPEPEPPAPQGDDEQKAELNLEQLAREVLPFIKRLLLVERERRPRR